MSQETSTPLNHISLDLEQWRSDISTFVDTTSQALNAIIAELSGSCSNGFSSKNSLAGSTHSYSQNFETAADLDALGPNSANGDTGQDDRLEKLKSQLSQRISKSI